MSSDVLRTPRTRLAILTAVALLGTADVAEFALTDPTVAFKTTGRATGTLFGLGVWTALTLAAAVGWRRPDNSRALATATAGLGAVAAIDGVGLALVHSVAKVGGVRPLAGAVLGLASLGLAVSLRARG